MTAKRDSLTSPIRGGNSFIILPIVSSTLRSADPPAALLAARGQTVKIKSAGPVIVRKPQIVDNIPPECEPRHTGNRGGLDDQIAEPDAEAGLRRKSRCEALGALLFAADEVAQNFFVIAESFVVATGRLGELASEDVSPGHRQRRALAGDQRHAICSILGAIEIDAYEDATESF